MYCRLLKITVHCVKGLWNIFAESTGKGRAVKNYYFIIWITRLLHVCGLEHERELVDGRICDSDTEPERR